MAEPESGWEWHDVIPGNGRRAEGDDLPSADLAQAFARCFRSDDGRRVLLYLTRMTTGRALGPAAPDSLLRHVEGQRQLVSHIHALIERASGALGTN